jgi:predicted nucleotidyltransferase
VVEGSVIASVRRYLRGARKAGIDARRAVLIGSHTRGTADEWSDIDIVVIAPELEGPADHCLVAKLWELRASTDPRIEPIPCGEREWETDGSRPILEIARREGVVIAA